VLGGTVGFLFQGAFGSIYTLVPQQALNGVISHHPLQPKHRMFRLGVSQIYNFGGLDRERRYGLKFILSLNKDVHCAPFWNPHYWNLGPAFAQSISLEEELHNIAGPLFGIWNKPDSPAHQSSLF